MKPFLIFLFLTPIIFFLVFGLFCDSEVLQKFYEQNIPEFSLDINYSFFKDLDFWETLAQLNQEYFFLLDFYSLACFINKLKEKSFSLIIAESPLTKQKVESRYNFASILGGAKILEKNPDCLYDKSVLDDNPDNYMINKCSSVDKYIVIRLTEDMLMHEFALINREFYSSNLRNFEVFGSVSSSALEWKSLGNFTALDVREWQNFKLKKETWVRFVKFVFLSHYGSAYHCTLSQIRIYGETMLVDFRNDLMKSFKEDFVETAKKKKPYIIPTPRRVSTLNLHKNIPLHHSHTKHHSTYSDPSKNRNFLYIFDEYCDNIPFFFNSTEQTIIVSNEKREDQEDSSKTWQQKEGICSNVGKYFRSKWREKQCLLNFQRKRVLENFGTVIVKENGNEMDLGVESIFKVLTKHIKVLKMNQIILQDFILKQEDVNSKVQSTSDGIYSMITNLNVKNFNLSVQLERTKRHNDELSSKIENLTLEIKNLQNTVLSESQFFLWKVLVISFLSCLSFVIFGYCLHNFNSKISQNNEKNIKFLEQYQKELEIRTPNNSSTQSELKSFKSRQKSKKKQKECKYIKSEERLGNQRFSHAADLVMYETNRKRSCSVEEKNFIWGFSPKQISRYIMKKIL